MHRGGNFARAYNCVYVVEIVELDREIVGCEALHLLELACNSSGLKCFSKHRSFGARGNEDRLCGVNARRDSWDCIINTFP